MFLASVFAAVNAGGYRYGGGYGGYSGYTGYRSTGLSGYAGLGGFGTGFTGAVALAPVATVAAAPVATLAAAPVTFAAAPAVSTAAASGPITAAIQTQRTVEVVDVPSTSQGAETQTVVIGPNVQPINLEFQTQASPLTATQSHLPTAPQQTQHSSYEEQPDVLRQDIVKPVIQDVRETVVPFRRITQEVRPVQESMHQILPRGQERGYVQASAATSTVRAAPAATFAAAPVATVAAVPVATVAAAPATVGFGFGATRSVGTVRGFGTGWGTGWGTGSHGWGNWGSNWGSGFKYGGKHGHGFSSFHSLKKK